MQRVIRHWMQVLLVPALLSAAFAAAAQSSVQGRDGVVVHYGTLNTNSLAAPVARRLGVQPRSSHALITLSPRDASGEALRATASGSVRRLTGQRQTLNFRVVENDGQPEDLIAEFEIQNGEHLNFEIEVDTAGSPYPVEIRFRQQFYRD